MTHDDAFLQAIIESPDDDGPRLVYADWLTDHGDQERAEFIRVQCELARVPEGDPRRPALKALERELLGEHEGGWVEPLRGVVEKWEFRRGFIEAVRLEPEHFLTHAAAMLAWAPILLAEFGAEWGDTPRLLSLLGTHPSLHRLRSICLYFGSGRIDEAGLQTLSGSPPLLQRLTGLVASDCLITEAGLRPVVMSPHLTRLWFLFLCGCGLHGEAAVRPLTDSPRLHSLTHLCLLNNELGDGGVQVLVGSPNCGRLERLDLQGCGLTDAGAQALADSPHLGRLESLDLSGNGISEATMQQLLGRFGDRVRF